MTQKFTRLQAAERAAEVAEAKAKAAREKLHNLRKEQDKKARIEARKARQSALYQVAELVEMAGLLEMDKGALLGGLLAVAEIVQQVPASPRFQQWKQRGDALLAEKEATKKPSDTTPDPVETQGTPEPISSSLTDEKSFP